MTEMHCKIFQQGGGNDTRPYVSPEVEVIGIEPQSFVMAGSDVSTGRLTNEDFEW